MMLSCTWLSSLIACSTVLKIQEFIDEIAITKTFNHPNVIPLIGACLKTSSQDMLPLMVIPFMRHGDVKSFLTSRRGNKIDLTELPRVNNYVPRYHYIVCFHLFAVY